MGLLSFSGEHPTLKEVKIAKNYLDERELRAMGQLVSGYLDFAERQAEREAAMTMKDWAGHLDRILVSTGEQLLEGNGSISHIQALNFLYFGGVYVWLILNILDALGQMKTLSKTVNY